MPEQKYTDVGDWDHFVELWNATNVPAERLGLIHYSASWQYGPRSYPWPEGFSDIDFYCRVAKECLGDLETTDGNYGTRVVLAEMVKKVLLTMIQTMVKLKASDHGYQNKLILSLLSDKRLYGLKMSEEPYRKNITEFLNWSTGGHREVYHEDWYSAVLLSNNSRLLLSVFECKGKDFESIHKYILEILEKMDRKGLVSLLRHSGHFHSPEECRQLIICFLELAVKCDKLQIFKDML